MLNGYTICEVTNGVINGNRFMDWIDKCMPFWKNIPHFYVVDENITWVNIYIFGSQVKVSIFISFFNSKTGY